MLCRGNAIDIILMHDHHADNSSLFLYHIELLAIFIIPSVTCRLSVEGHVQMSADNIAISLLRRFSEKQLPKASELEWLVSADDVPQEV